MFSIVENRKIKAALVGCGRISARHFDAFRQHRDDLELVAVCDCRSGRAAVAAEAHGGIPYVEYEALLEKCACDLVVLTTPSGLHPQQTLQAAGAGRSVVVEKPMATRWRDGLDMVRECDRARVKLFVVKQNRNNPTLRLLKRAIDEKRFGQIHMAAINVFWTRPQEYYDSEAWRGTWELDGGALMNQASHYVDLLEWLIGPVADVQAMTGTLARDIEVEDTAVLNVRWRRGTLGTVGVTMLAYPKNYEGSITVLGEKGLVRVGGVAANRVDHWEFADEREYDARVGEAGYATASVYGFGHAQYYRNVIDVFRGLAEPETDGREGLKSLEVLVAAYKSARERLTVSLPLEW